MIGCGENYCDSPGWHMTLRFFLNWAWGTYDVPGEAVGENWA